VIKLPDTSFFKAAKKVFHCIELSTFPVQDLLSTAFNLFDEFRVQAFFRRIRFLSTIFFTAKLASGMNAFHMEIVLSYKYIRLLIGSFVKEIAFMLVHSDPLGMLSCCIRTSR
jgi:hypothetical protein